MAKKKKTEELAPIPEEKIVVCEANHDRLIQLWRKAEQKDKTLTPAELKALREMLAKSPDLLGYAGFSISMTNNIIDAIDSNTMTKELLREEIHRMRQSFGYETASRLEKLAIDHVCMCYIRQWLTEVRYAHNTNQSLTLNQGMFWEKKLNATQARYIKAIETLGQVRRLKLPNVQINIADKQQVNNNPPVNHSSNGN